VIDKEGILFGQDPGVPPLLFMRSAIGFLMTTESQDLGLTSHPKDDRKKVKAQSHTRANF